MDKVTLFMDKVILFMDKVTLAASVCFTRRLYRYFLSMDKVILSMDKIWQKKLYPWIKSDFAQNF